MSYNVDYDGEITIDPPLNADEIAYLDAFNSMRHVRRQSGPYTISHTDVYNDRDVTDTRRPDEQMPDLYCNWTPSADGAVLTHDGREKANDGYDWMVYLINTFLKPGALLEAELKNRVPGRTYPAAFDAFTFNHTLNGRIEVDGEERTDVWNLVVTDNEVTQEDVL